MAIPFLIPSAVAIASEFFPMLATKLAGRNAGDVAETVVNAAAGAAGLPPDTDVRTIIDRIKAEPGAAEQLRYQFEVLNQQEHERSLEDRKDARRYQLAAGGDGRTRGNWMLGGVSLGLVSCIMVAYLASGGRGSVDPALLALVTTVAGALLKMLGDAFAFEFGSSRGSREKDSQLADFRESMLQVGKENRRAATELIRDSQAQIPNIAQQVIKATDSAIAAGASAVATGSAAVGKAVDRVLERRDFVSQLAAGQI